jgi:SAM-dependent methyltransferase
MTTQVAAAAGAFAKTLTPTSMLNGYTASVLVYAFERIGLWTLVAAQTGRTVDELAAELSLDRARLAAMVDAACRLDILELDADGGVRPSDLGRSLLVEKSRFIVAVGGYGDVFHHLAELAQQTMRFGVDVRRDDVQVARGCAQTLVPEVVEAFEHALDSVDFRVMADIGCADASRLVQACWRHPHIRAVGIDISPEACDLARRRIADAGLSDRIDIVCADVLDIVADPARYADRLARVDLVASSFMVHHLIAHPAHGPRIMQLLQGAFPSARHFLIADHVQAPPGADPEREAVFSLEFELLHSFMEVPTPTRQSYDRVFAAAGLRVEQVHRFGHPDELLYLLATEALS